ncbi:hypothetical protein RCL1_004614 [Eukaryota sp. TZLM3-RCL]
MSAWPTIESDPGVFSELLQKMGVSGLKVEELYSLDQTTLASLPHVFGLIFLFKWTPGRLDAAPSVLPIDEGLYFARQLISNSCATQALLNIIMNIPLERIGEEYQGNHHITFSPELMEFRNSTWLFDPDAKGIAIANCPFLREAHQSFERPAPVPMEASAAGKEEDVFHFIAFVPHSNSVYQLDGLSRHGPVKIGEFADDWVSVAVPSIQENIAQFGTAEIRFSVLAVVADPREECRKMISDLEKAIEGIEEKEDQASEELFELRAKRAHLVDFLAAEERTFERWRVENIRRRFNYVPFLTKLIELLSQRGELFGAIESAKKH